MSTPGSDDNIAPLLGITSTATSIGNSIGMRLDSIYDEMCAMVHPGVPITATITPDTDHEAHEAHERSSTWTMI